MFVLQEAQFRAIEQELKLEFENRAWLHLQRWSPQHCALLGEKQMRQVIRYGWEKANRYGLSPECCVLSFLDLMCLLGGGFDVDPLLPWAAEILAEPAGIDPVGRGDRLHEAAWKYMECAIRDYRDAQGKPVTENIVVLFRELRAQPQAFLGRENFGTYSSALENLISRYFPAKCACVGYDRLPEVAVAGARKAREYGITSVRGSLFFGVLMFSLGRQFDDDPLLPWVPKLLRDPSITDPEQRVERLFTQGAAELRRWWDLSEKGTH